jgi:hypothetical protein
LRHFSGMQLPTDNAIFESYNVIFESFWFDLNRKNISKALKKLSKKQVVKICFLKTNLW